ncbi:hypothetical protein IPF86_00290 [Candidatus Nomurabacteria bacterium]|nr:MAG: hypothetical protein IPF86_00290 [Candidatus Nomurabacteria bacterium]
MARLTDYLLTPGDVYGWLTTLHKRDYIGAGLVALVVVLGTVVLSFEGGVFLAFATALFYWHIDSRFAITCALVCLILIPILLILTKFMFVITDATAERVATFAFYFLSIGVIKQIWEYSREAKAKK